MGQRALQAGLKQGHRLNFAVILRLVRIIVLKRLAEQFIGQAKFCHALFCQSQGCHGTDIPGDFRMNTEQGTKGFTPGMFPRIQPAFSIQREDEPSGG